MLAGTQPDYAAASYAEVLAAFERVLGPDHPRTVALRGHPVRRSPR